MLKSAPYTMVCNKVNLHGLELSASSTPRTLLFCKSNNINVKVSPTGVELNCDFDLKPDAVKKFLTEKAAADEMAAPKYKA